MAEGKLHVCIPIRFSCVQLSAILWTVACKAHLSMGFSRQEYCSGLPCPPPSSVQVQFNSFQSLSRVWLFVTPLTAAHQASLSITNSQRLLKLMSIESVMPSNHFILCRPLLLPPSIFPSIRVFSNESVDGWFPLRLTGLISLQSKHLEKHLFLFYWLHQSLWLCGSQQTVEST